jgi:hypothetical protein
VARTLKINVSSVKWLLETPRIELDDETPSGDELRTLGRRL